jgi:hypothetical protein
MAVADEDGVTDDTPVPLLLALIECAKTVAADSEADNEGVAILFVLVDVAVDDAPAVFPVSVADGDDVPVFVLPVAGAVAEGNGVFAETPVALLLALIEFVDAETAVAETDPDNEGVAILLVLVDVAVDDTLAVLLMEIADPDGDDVETDVNVITPEITGNATPSVTII